MRGGKANMPAKGKGKARAVDPDDEEDIQMRSAGEEVEEQAGPTSISAVSTFTKSKPVPKSTKPKSSTKPRSIRSRHPEEIRAG
jgi:hypothetical protein